MLSAAIDAQAAERGVTQGVLGQHALDRNLHRELGLLLHQDAVLGLFQTAGPAGVVAIVLLLAFVAGEDSLGSVEDDDKVAAVNVGGVLGLVLAAQQVGGGGSGLAQGLARRIKDIPLAGDSLLANLSL